MRQAVYDRISVLRRARLHRRVAEAYEALPGGTDGHLSQLATHYLAAAADGAALKAIEYANRAAQQALNRVAYEEAVNFCEQALEVFQWADLGDGPDMCDQLLTLAHCHSRAGDVALARETYRRAAALARRLHDGERLAMAALGDEADLGGYTRALVADFRLIAELEEALAEIGAGDSSLRARLLGRLAVELFFTPNAERRRALSDEAVAIALRLGDARLVLTTKSYREWATLGPDVPLADRLAAADAILELAFDLGDREMAYQARYLRLLVFLEAGDFASAEIEAAEGRKLADELRVPGYLPWVRAYEATRAWVDGRVAEGKRLNAMALDEALATDADPELVFAMIGGQAILFSYLRGEMIDIKSVVDAMHAEHPEQTSIRLARCLLSSLLSLDDECRTLFQECVDDGQIDSPRDGAWILNMALLGMVCGYLRDAEIAASLIEKIEPVVDRWAGGAGLTWGPIRRVLGILQGVCGRHDEAEAHLRAAIDQCAAIPAPIFQAECFYNYAVVLVDRNAPGDVELARKSLDDCLAISDRLGLDLLTGWADQLAGRLP